MDHIGKAVASMTEISSDFTYVDKTQLVNSLQHNDSCCCFMLLDIDLGLQHMVCSVAVGNLPFSLPENHNIKMSI